MKKKLTFLISTLMCVTLLCSCGLKQATYTIPTLTDYSAQMTLADYSNLTYDIDEGQYIVNDQLITDTIYQTYYSSITAVDIGDKSISNGDIVTLKINCTINNTPVYWTDGTEYTLGRHAKSDLFDSHIIGHKVGDSISFEIDYPADYADPTYAGHIAKYEMEILSAKTKYVEITDDFAMSYTPYHTHDELYEAFKTALEEDAKAARNQEIFMQYMSYLIENSTYQELPNFDGIKSDINAAFATSADQLGITDTEYRNTYLGITDAEYEEWLDAKATEYIKTRMVISEIARRENLTVTQEEYDNYINNTLSQYGVNTISELPTSSDAAQEALIDLLSTKVMNFLLEKSQQ